MRTLRALILIIPILLIPVFAFGKCPEVKGWKENVIPEKYEMALKTDLSDKVKFASPLHFTLYSKNGEEYFYYRTFILNLSEGSLFNEDLVVVAEDMDFPNGRYIFREIRWWHNGERMFWSDGSCFLGQYLSMPKTMGIPYNSLW